MRKSPAQGAAGDRRRSWAAASTSLPNRSPANGASSRRGSPDGTRVLGLSLGIRWEPEDGTGCRFRHPRGAEPRALVPAAAARADRHRHRAPAARAPAARRTLDCASRFTRAAETARDRDRGYRGGPARIARHGLAARTGRRHGQPQRAARRRAQAAGALPHDARQPRAQPQDAAGGDARTARPRGISARSTHAAARAHAGHRPASAQAGGHGRQRRDPHRPRGTGAARTVAIGARQGLRRQAR